MEIVLNLAFLVIAMAAFAHWLSLPSSRRNIYETLKGALVLGCALMLLFPCISMTDDLQAASDVFEDARVSVRKVQVVPAGQQAAVPVPTITLAVLPVFAGWTAEERIILHQDPTGPSPTGRAPPTF